MYVMRTLQIHFSPRKNWIEISTLRKMISDICSLEDCSQLVSLYTTIKLPLYFK